MNIQEVLSILNSQDAIYNLYFTRKLKRGYASFSPNVDEQIYEDLLGLVISNITNHTAKEQIKYNPTGYRDETIEYCSSDYVENYEDVLASFNNADTVDTEINPDNFSFYCIEIKVADKDVKFYRRVTKFKRLTSEGFIARFSGRTLNKIETKLIGLDGNIDLVVYENEILILSHYSLERIFSLKDKFLDTADAFLNKIEQFSLIDNFSNFKGDCLNDGRFIKTLTKMSNENINVELLIEKFNNVKTTIDMFELPIEIDETNSKIIYNDKGQINDILRIIRDCYYISLINGEKGVDNKI